MTPTIDQHITTQGTEYGIRLAEERKATKGDRYPVEFETNTVPPNPSPELVRALESVLDDDYPEALDTFYVAAMEGWDLMAT